MARPTDWTPVADQDPAPGDTDAIRGQVVKLTRVADSILDQVAALQRVAAAQQDGMLAGQFVGTIGAKAGDLADHLGKAEGRYRTASSELKQWLTALENAQSDSLTQLNNAVTAQKTIDATDPSIIQSSTLPSTDAPPPSPLKSSAPTRTPEQQHVLDDAHATVDAARREIARIREDLDAQAALRERNIKAACQHDGLKDSRWDRLKTDLHGTFGRIVSDVCNGLGWIATGLAIAALFFPGVDLLVLGALAATALSLGGHSLLASAGAGSWFDVGVDVVGLASFGVGKVVGKGLEASVSGLKSTLESGAAVRAGAKALAFAKTSEGVDALESLMNDGGVDIAKKASALSELNRNYGAANAIKQTTMGNTRVLAGFNADFSHAGMVRPGVDVLLEGDHEAAAIRTWLKKVTAVAGADPAVAQGVTTVTRQLNKAQGTYGFASAVDLGDKTYGSVFPYLGVPEGNSYYQHTRWPFTYTTGSSW